MVSVMADAAICWSVQEYYKLEYGLRATALIRRTGAMTVDLMLYLAPSAASVFVKATRPILAAL